MEQKKVIGENIKTARKLKGLSQRALAEKLGIAFLDKLTSPSGVADLVAAAQEQQRYAPLRGPATYSTEGALNKLHADLPGLITTGLAESHSMKIIVTYLEDIISLLRQAPQEPRPLRHVADSRAYGVPLQERQQIPLPPLGLEPEERNKWERNAAALLRWSQSEKSFWVPQWAVEKFCREIEESQPIGDPDVTSKILRDYLEQGKS